MAGVKISALPKLTSISTEDYIIVNDDNIKTRSIKFSDFITSLNDNNTVTVSTKNVRLSYLDVEEQTRLAQVQNKPTVFVENQSDANVIILDALLNFNDRLTTIENLDTSQIVELFQDLSEKVDNLEASVISINSELTSQGNQIIDINNQLTNQGQQITDINNEITQINEILGDTDEDLTSRIVALESKTEYFEPTVFGDIGEDDPKTIIDSSLLLQDPRSQYAIEFLDYNPDRPSGSFIVRNYNTATRGQLFDDIIVEQYWDPNVGKYKFHVAGPNEPAEGVSMQMDEEVLEIFVDTNIKGGLFVNDVDVLQQIDVVKALAIAEVTGLSLALKTKYNKEGGDVVGPLQVKPGGPLSATLFSVSPTGPESVVAPASNFSLTNKKYVDDKFADAGNVKSVAGKEGDVILVKDDIVDFEDSDYATAAQGEKADTALQPNDNVSELVNDAGYLVQSDLDGLSNALVFKGSIDATTDYPASVSTGDVWANTTTGTADVQWTGLTNVTSGDLIAKGENQWVVVGASTVPDLSGYVEFGDNVSDLANDAGYITEAEAVSAAPVQSVAGKDGNVSLVKADITDLVEADYATAAQGEKADTALQPNDNVSELANDAGYVTKQYSDDEDDKIKDLLGDSIADINLQLGKYDHVFNYKVVEVFSQEEGEMTANSEDPAVNTMFVLDKIQSDGTAADFISVAEENDILIIEQNINQRLRYEVIQVIDTGDQFAINCDFLDTDGTGATEFIFNRLATVYIEKADSDRSDFVTENYVNSNFLNKYGGTVTDATANVNYKWNKNTDIASDNILSLASGGGKYLALYPSTEARVYVKSNSADTVRGFTVVKGSSDYQFSVKADGSIEAGRDAANAFVATNDNHITTKKYVDAYAMPKNLNTLPSLP